MKVPIVSKVSDKQREKMVIRMIGKVARLEKSEPIPAELNAAKKVVQS
jgi:hypothetical protein